MTKDEYITLFNKSRVIVDITTQSQSGMAMRVTDALGAGNRILNCNRYITREPNYTKGADPDTCPHKHSIPDGFLEDRKFKKYDYSIDLWLSRIFR